jgi:type I restriction enzyme R subunit
LPEFFKDENELRIIWSNPVTRNVFLEKLAEAGYGTDELTTLQKLIDQAVSKLKPFLQLGSDQR